MSGCECGAETVTALTPGGRLVELDVDHVWVRHGEPWPRVFIVGVAGGQGGPAVPHATPALALTDATPPVSGPYRKEHACAVRTRP